MRRILPRLVFAPESYSREPRPCWLKYPLGPDLSPRRNNDPNSCLCDIVVVVITRLALQPEPASFQGRVGGKRRANNLA